MDKETKVSIQVFENELIKLVQEEFEQYSDYEGLTLDKYKFTANPESGKITLHMEYSITEKDLVI